MPSNTLASQARTWLIAREKHPVRTTLGSYRWNLDDGRDAVSHLPAHVFYRLPEGVGKRRGIYPSYEKALLAAIEAIASALREGWVAPRGEL